MQIKTVDCKTLKMWLENKLAILIDVREIAENNSSRIQGSTLIPLAQIDIDLIPEIQDKNLVIHCKAGKRSFVACEKLLSQNPDLKIYNLEGGIDAWQKQGFEVLSNKNN